MNETMSNNRKSIFKNYIVIILVNVEENDLI